MKLIQQYSKINQYNKTYSKKDNDVKVRHISNIFVENINR